MEEKTHRDVKKRAKFFPLMAIIISLLAFNLCTAVNAGKGFCPKEASVNLTNAVRNATGFISESGHFFPADIVRNEEGVLLGCMCDVKPCITLCPPLRNKSTGKILGPEYFRNTTAEIPQVYTTSRDADDLPLEPNQWFHLFAWDPCIDLSTPLIPTRYKNDEWYLLRNGSLFLPRRNGTHALMDWRQYCFWQKLNETIYTARQCGIKSESQINIFGVISFTGCLVSMPFLIITIFVYSILPELRNIHGKTLSVYLGCLLATYICLGVDRATPTTSKILGMTCPVRGFTIYFLFISTFLWLNVICFDVWWRFRSYGSLKSAGNIHDRKKFIWYSIYAWVTAFATTAICIVMEYSPSIPNSVIRPGLSQRLCWFTTMEAKALYFLGPVCLTIICNICFFVSTSIRLMKHKRNTQRELDTVDSTCHDENQLCLSVYLKLFVIMGINWSMEVISGLWKAPENLWIVTDMVNSLQGVLIFIMFVCKKKIWQSLKMRFEWRPRFHRQKCTTTQSVTRPS